MGWEFVFIDLWQPLFVVCFIFFVPLLILAAVSIFLDLRRARRALRRTRRVIWPWLLARGWVAARFATAKRGPKRIRCRASSDGPCD